MFNHGVLVLAGTTAVDYATLQGIPAGRSVGFTAGKPPFVLVVAGESATSTLVQVRAKTEVNPVNLNCVSDTPSLIASFNAHSLTFTPQAATIPGASDLTAAATVTFTCTVECPGVAYQGNEAAQFTVRVLPRALSVRPSSPSRSGPGT